MLAMNVLLNGEGALRNVPKDKLIHLKTPITVTALEGGMESGKPSVAFIFELPDGKTVVAETSMMLFQSAATLFRARFGDLE